MIGFAVINMDMVESIALAYDLLKEHNLDSWNVEVIETKRVLGQCDFTKKIIRLSRPFVVLNDKDVVVDTIKHEIAHALVGVGHGHDWKWKQMCEQLGCIPSRFVLILHNVDVDFMMESVGGVKV